MKVKTSTARLRASRLLLAALASAPAAVSAGEGWYFGLEAGANFARDQEFEVYDISQFVPDGARLGEVRFDDGWIGGLATGYAFSGGFRPELALEYRRNDFSHLRREPLAGDPGVSTDRVDGGEKLATALLNFWFDLRPEGRWHPYFGIGAGAARIEVKDGRYDASTLDDDSDTVFAYQAGAGIGWDLGPRWTLSLDYRYLETESGEFDLLPSDPNSHVEARVKADTVMLGLRYGFGSREVAVAPPAEPPVEVVPPVELAAAPVPVPAPAAAPCRADGQALDLEGCKLGDTLVLRGVNFDFDKASLTINARSLLLLVAEELKSHPRIAVEIDGHTDGKGSPVYNQKLSERRAESVRQFLASQGVAPSRLAIRGFGASVPVADNASEEGRELNRRVELKVTGTASP